ncbi:hypothetical protein [Halomonas smyrnensis]|uniref:hypothetical protein n=1 Tax=Halomonas smyrnensis TaxID=720605 RepID=UPI0002E9909B|nr:hypothetical protein [Halomonas smyrnensis]
MPSANEMTALDIWHHLQRDHQDHPHSQRAGDVDTMSQSDLRRTDRPERSALVWEVCQRLPAHIDEHGRVTATAVGQMADELYEWTIAHQNTPPRRHHHRRSVVMLLASLNALPGLTIQIPTQPVRPPRPSHAPTSIQEAQGLAAMLLVDRHLDTWRQHTQHRDRGLLTVALRLSCRLGMGSEVLLGTLAMLGTRHVDTATRQIRLPSQLQHDRDSLPTGQANPSQTLGTASPQDPAYQPMHYYTLTLPRAVWEPLRHLVHTAAGDQERWLALKSPSAPIATLKTRQKQLRERLDRAAKALVREMKTQHPQHRALLERLSGWPRMSRWGPMMAQRKGLAAIWLDILSEYPLPTDSREPITVGADRGRYAPAGGASRHHARSDSDVLRFLDDGQATPRPHEAASMPRPDDLAITAPGAGEGSAEPLSIEQSFALRHAVRTFSRQLPTLTTGKRLSGQVYREPLQQLRRRTFDTLTDIVGTSDSFGHWLVAFSCARLISHGDTISSVQTYLGRLMPTPLLLNEAIADVPGWDQDSVDELCAEGQSYGRWNHNTRQHFLRTMGMFVRFCQDYGILDDVVPPSSTTARISTRRTRLINPVQMDHAWKALVGHARPSQTNTQFALTLALGYYGGLRASEVYQLTLRDVRLESPTVEEDWAALQGSYAWGRHLSTDADPFPIPPCWIYIRQGKTPSARRRIPLHLLAPPEVIHCMNQWWETRRTVAPTLPLKEIGLFGPLFSPQAYRRQGLIDPLLNWLRNRWGEGVDFHGLRHCAASWWQLRLQAAQHDDFRETLHYTFHWMFQPSSLEAFLTYLCGAEGDDAIERGTLMGQLAKLIGHRHVNTLLHTYTHSLGMIHSHEVNRTWSNRKVAG